MENNRPYSKEDYKKAVETVYTFHQRCYETIDRFIKNNGAITINPDNYPDWRFDFLEHDGTMQVIRIEINAGDVVLVCEDENGSIVKISWEEINHDMIVTTSIMELVFSLSSNEPHTDSGERKFCPFCGHTFEQGEGDYNYDTSLIDYTCPECKWEGTEPLSEERIMDDLSDKLGDGIEIIPEDVDNVIKELLSKDYGEAIKTAADVIRARLA